MKVRCSATQWSGRGGFTSCGKSSNILAVVAHVGSLPTGGQISPIREDLGTLPLYMEGVPSSSHIWDHMWGDFPHMGRLSTHGKTSHIRGRLPPYGKTPCMGNVPIHGEDFPRISHNKMQGPKLQLPRGQGLGHVRYVRLRKDCL
jgi:hypothetical protein